MVPAKHVWDVNRDALGRNLVGNESNIGTESHMRSLTLRGVAWCFGWRPCLYLALHSDCQS